MPLSKRPVYVLFIFTAFRLIFISMPANAQIIHTLSLQPEISIDYKVNEKLSLNFNNYWLSDNIEKLYPEGNFYSSSESQHTITTIYMLNNNFDLGAAYELKINHNKFVNNDFTNRSIEFVNFSITVEQLSISQRLQFEQHYKNTIVFRNRYRLALKYPIYKNSNGINKLNAVVSEELLWSLNTETKAKLNQRFIIALDYQWNRLISSEIGLQLRTRNISESNSSNIIIGLITIGIDLHELF